MAKLTTAQKNKRKRERKKRERAERLEQEKAAAQKEVSKDLENNIDVEIEYVAEPLFPAAVNGADANGDTNMAAPAASGDGANANAEEDDGQDLQAVMRRFQDRASTTYVVTDEETNNEGGDNTKGSNEVKDADDEALEDENGEMLSKRKLKVSFCAHLVLIIICFISFYCKYHQSVFALYRYYLFNDTYYYYFIFITPYAHSNLSV